MTQDFSYNHVQYSDGFRSLPGSWRLGTLAIAIALVSGCASSGGVDSSGAGDSIGEPVASANAPSHHELKQNENRKSPPNTQEMAEAGSEKRAKKAVKTVDQSPIVVGSANTDIADNPEKPITDADKESDMTVLVLDNPELIAKAAQMNGIDSQVTTMDDSPRKPHRMKFHYGFNKHRLSDEERALLLKHAAYLKAHPDVTVQINGHTDNYGADEYNDFLSRLRAKTAARVLEEAGADKQQITVRGWGSRKPLTNPEDRAANRRIDLEYQSEQMAKAQ